MDRGIRRIGRIEEQNEWDAVEGVPPLEGYECYANKMAWKASLLARRKWRKTVLRIRELAGGLFYSEKVYSQNVCAECSIFRFIR